MTREIRPLTDESGYTCDWGGCDDVATAERYDAGHGWLPVCEHHEGKPARRSPGKRMCPVCATEYALNVDGRIRAHDQGWDRCPGSGTVVA